MAGKFELYKDKAGGYRFRLKAANGEIVLVSESYKTRASADQGVASVRKNAPSDARYERKASSSGKYMFNLKATNGQVIGTSEQYASEMSRDAGIEVVKKTAPDAELVDQTG
ncbi:MAG: YegP family protein [Thiogranum sp.]|nr:YegP family protein [Thiogranum sp.]